MRAYKLVSKMQVMSAGAVDGDLASMHPAIADSSDTPGEPSSALVTHAFGPKDNDHHAKQRALNCCSNCGWPFDWPGSTGTHLTGELRNIEDVVLQRTEKYEKSPGLFSKSRQAHVFHNHMKKCWPSGGYESGCSFLYPMLSDACQSFPVYAAFLNSTRVSTAKGRQERDRVFTERYRNMFEKEFNWEQQVSLWVEKLCSLWQHDHVYEQKCRSLGIHVDGSDPTRENVEFCLLELYGGAILQCALVMLLDKEHRHEMNWDEPFDTNNFVRGLSNMFEIAHEVTVQVVTALRTGISLRSQLEGTQKGRTRHEKPNYSAAWNQVRLHVRKKDWHDYVFAACNRCNNAHTCDTSAYHCAYYLFRLKDIKKVDTVGKRLNFSPRENYSRRMLHSAVDAPSGFWQNYVEIVHSIADQQDKSELEQMSVFRFTSLFSSFGKAVQDSIHEHGSIADSVDFADLERYGLLQVYVQRIALADTCVVSANLWTRLQLITLSKALHRLHISLDDLKKNDDINISDANHDVWPFLARVGIVYNSFLNLLACDERHITRSIIKNAGSGRSNITEFNQTVPAQVLRWIRFFLVEVASKFRFRRAWNDDSGSSLRIKTLDAKQIKLKMRSHLINELQSAQIKCAEKYQCTPLEAVYRFLSHTVRVSTILQLNPSGAFPKNPTSDPNLFKERIKTRSNSIIEIIENNITEHRTFWTHVDTDNPKVRRPSYAASIRNFNNFKATFKLATCTPALHHFGFVLSNEDWARHIDVFDNQSSLFQHCFTTGGLYDYIEAMTRVNIQSAACLFTAKRASMEPFARTRNWEKKLAYVLPSAASLWATASMWMSLQVLHHIQNFKDGETPRFVQHLEILWRFVVVECAALRVRYTQSGGVEASATNVVKAMGFRRILESSMHDLRSGNPARFDAAQNSLLHTVQCITRSLYTRFLETDNGFPLRSGDKCKPRDLAPGYFWIAVVLTFQCGETDQAVENLLLALNPGNIRKNLVTDKLHDIHPPEHPSRENDDAKITLYRDSDLFCPFDGRQCAEFSSILNIMRQWRLLRTQLPNQGDITLLLNFKTWEVVSPSPPQVVESLEQTAGSTQHATRIMLRLAQLLCIDTDENSLSSAISLKLQVILRATNPLRSITSG